MDWWTDGGAFLQATGESGSPRHSKIPNLTVEAGERERDRRLGGRAMRCDVMRRDRI